MQQDWIEYQEHKEVCSNEQPKPATYQADAVANLKI
jgi:hypothetical protein